MISRYPLGPLLSARIYREDAAARAAVAARNAFEAAKAAAETARDELRRYQEWRPEEERRLFARLRGKDVPLAAVDRHREDVQRLREGEIARERAFRAADHAAGEAEAALERAKQFHLAASRDRRKIEEHRARWLEEARRRMEAAEAMELEEFAVRSRTEEPPEDAAGPEEAW